MGYKCSPGQLKNTCVNNYGYSAKLGTYGNPTLNDKRKSKWVLLFIVYQMQYNSQDLILTNIPLINQENGHPLHFPPCNLTQVPGRRLTCEIPVGHSNNVIINTCYVQYYPCHPQPFYQLLGIIASLWPCSARPQPPSQPHHSAHRRPSRHQS